LINYDLHWNPVRLIQRLGRIDRIGSQHDVIWAFNFLPETELDRSLGLRETLRRRIAEIHETIGEDAAILDPSEQLNEKAMYAIYEVGNVGEYEEDDVDEFVDLHEAEEIIRQLRQSQPELYKRIAGIRDGVRCGRKADQQGSVILCRAGRYRQLMLVNEQGEIVNRDAPSILGILKCDPDARAEPLPEGYNRIVMRVKEQFAQEVKARRAEREHTLSLTHAQRYVLRELRALYDATEDGDLREQIAMLEAVFRQPNPRPAVAKALNQIRRDGLAGIALVESLLRLYTTYGLSAESAANRATLAENDEVPRIVCSEGLVM